jgi:arylsulfatase A-like enzyme
MHWARLPHQRMPGRTRLLAGLACAAALLNGSCAPRLAARAIIVVSFDTLRPDHLGCYGYPRATSPNLDAFRRDAVLFSQAIAQAPSTLPSHASIFTSLIPQHHGASIARHAALSPDHVTLAEVLRSRGFATAAIHGGAQLSPVWGLDQGFDSYIFPKPWHDFSVRVRAATTWLAVHHRDPFFLFLHTYEVHRPYKPAPRFLAAVGVGGLRTEAEDPAIGRLVNEVREGRRELEPSDVERVVGLYDAGIRSADEAFGRLLEWLRANGLYDEALILVTSDHGEEFGEHGMLAWHSHTLYHELLRVVLLVKLPRSRGAGTTVDSQVRGIDVAPTVLAAAGIEPPSAFEGASLLPLVDGGPPPPQVSVAGDDSGQLSAIRVPGWKLDGRRLFDLAADPGETRDVARSHRRTVRELREQRRRILASRPAPRPAPAAPDAATLERLRALGYLGTGADVATPAGPPR